MKTNALNAIKILIVIDFLIVGIVIFIMENVFLVVLLLEELIAVELPLTVDAAVATALVDQTVYAVIIAIINP